jgi:hypothetical protein
VRTKPIRLGTVGFSGEPSIYCLLITYIVINIYNPFGKALSRELLQ